MPRATTLPTMWTLCAGVYSTPAGQILICGSLTVPAASVITWLPPSSIHGELRKNERRKVECTRCARPPPSRGRDASTSLSLISPVPSLSTKPSCGLYYRRWRSHSAASVPLCRRTRWDRPSWSAPSGTHYSKVPAVRSVAPHFRAIVSTVTAVPVSLAIVQSVGVVAGGLAMRAVACCILLFASTVPVRIRCSTGAFIAACHKEVTQCSLLREQ